MTTGNKTETTNELLDIILECKSLLTSIKDNIASSEEVDQSMNAVRELSKQVQLSSKKWLAKS